MKCFNFIGSIPWNNLSNKKPPAPGPMVNLFDDQRVKNTKSSQHQFLKLCIGAGILPPLLTNFEQSKGLTGMIGA